MGLAELDSQRFRIWRELDTSPARTGSGSGGSGFGTGPDRSVFGSEVQILAWIKFAGFAAVQDLERAGHQPGSDLTKSEIGRVRIRNGSGSDRVWIRGSDPGVD